MTGKEKAKPASAAKSNFRELMKRVCTSVPGHILTFDVDKQLAQVRVGILRVDLDGATFAIAPIIEVPVCFPGDDFVLEHQISGGCEGMIHFSQRCVDGWLQTGGIAENPIGRFHDMQDAFFEPGYRSIPNAIEGFKNDGMRMRNKAGDQFVWLKGDGTISADNSKVKFDLLPDGSALMQNAIGSFQLMTDGSFVINGLTITPDGNLITALGVNVNQHTHYASDNRTPLTGKPIV
jgi:hypothetical protein